MVAALFTRRDSIYKTMGLDCYDEDRDATTFTLDRPVIAHPPCGSWGRMAQWCKHDRATHDLAWFALWTVRHCGGILEHPVTSRLWTQAGIRPNRRDDFGGMLVVIDQNHWGHPARKRTGLYAVGCEIEPRLSFEPITHKGVQWQCSAHREKTPPALAHDMVRWISGGTAAAQAA